MLDKIRQLADTARRFASREDLEAVAAANSIEFIHIKTGMTRGKFREAFGEFDPNTVCQLSVLADKNPPSNTQEWQKLAEEAEGIRVRMFGK
ncbi:MAG: hypothetical protein AAB383_01970 [Patescibacteria group bacterium]